MGPLVVTVEMENLEDVYAADAGRTTLIRTVVVDDAVVDTGSVGLMVPRELVARLGLRPNQTRPGVYEAVRLTIQGRDCTAEAYAIPDDQPVRVGIVPLNALDWVVDPLGQRLIGNPDHGGEHMIDALGVQG